MDKVIPVKFNVIYCSSVTCHVVVLAKAKHDGGMDGRIEDGRNDHYFSDKNDTPDRHCLIVWRSRRARSRSSASACLMSFDHLQVADTAGGISNRVEWPLCAICFLFCFVLSLFHLWICFSLRLFLFCQGRRHFLRVTNYRARYFFFRSENFCRTFGPAHWRFLSDILKKCPIVRQVRRISTALRFGSKVSRVKCHVTLTLYSQNVSVECTWNCACTSRS